MDEPSWTEQAGRVCQSLCAVCYTIPSTVLRRPPVVAAQLHSLTHPSIRSRGRVFHSSLPGHTVHRNTESGEARAENACILPANLPTKSSLDGTAARVRSTVPE